MQLCNAVIKYGTADLIYRYVLKEWMEKCSGDPYSVSTIEGLCVESMAEMYAHISDPADSGYNLDLRERAATFMIELAGFEHRRVARSVQMFLWIMADGTGNHDQRIHDFLFRTVPMLSSTNFVAIVKAIHLWSIYLERRKQYLMAEGLLVNALLTLWYAPDEFRVNWKFHNDPLLDVAEHLMVFHHDTLPRPFAFFFWRALYIDHFQRRYGSPLLYEFLGCGIGRLGMSWGRSMVQLVRSDDGSLESEVILDDGPAMNIHGSRIPVPLQPLDVDEFKKLCELEKARTGSNPLE